MKTRIQAGLLLFSLHAFILYKALAQPAPTAAQWQADLLYLQQKVHRQYPHLFYNVSAKQFDSAVNDLQKKIPVLKDMEIKLGFIRLIGMFRIGHTGVRFMIGDDPENMRPMFHYYPVTLYPFSDGLYIRSIAASYSKAVGGKVIRIGNDPVPVVLKKLHALIPCENEQYFRNNLQYYIRLPEMLQGEKITPTDREMILTYQKDSKEDTVRIKAEIQPEDGWHTETQLPKGWVDSYPSFDTPAAALWLKNPGSLRYFEYLENSRTLYVRHSAVRDDEQETIADFFSGVYRFADQHEVDKLVLDLRLNGGGNNYLNKPVITGIIELKKINRHGHFFVITGPGTFSAAQNLCNELEKYTEAIFVGEPTGENINFWGDVETEILPNSKLNIVLSNLWWQNSDPRDKRPWMPPELAASMSFKDYSTGYDSSMETVLRYHNEKRIEEELRELLEEGKKEEALAKGREWLQDPRHRYRRDELEAKLDDAGWLLALRNKAGAACDFFYLNSSLYPASANACFSLAQALWQLGKKEEAIKNLQLAIQKDPQGKTGEESRKMLALIRRRS